MFHKFKQHRFLTNQRSYKIFLFIMFLVVLQINIFLLYYWKSLINKDYELLKLREEIKCINEKQFIFNTDKFGFSINNIIAIEVQVQNTSKKSIPFLSYLLESLSKVTQINTTLLIFSLDYMSDNVAYNISTIKFARVMLIYFPYSIQAYPQGYPKQNPSQDSTAEESIIEMENKQVALKSQHKLHWWWKANFIFKQLRVNYSGDVIFLKESDYAAPDMLHAHRLLRGVIFKYSADVLILGQKLKDYEMQIFASDRWYKYMSWLEKKSSKHMNEYDQGDIQKTPWNTDLTVGLAFNKTTWNRINKCFTFYCSYDDCNWDHSLENVAYECYLGSHLSALSYVSPHVFDLNQCADLSNPTICLTMDFNITLVRHILTKVGLVGRYLYPVDVSLTKETLIAPPKAPVSGGWDSTSNQQLCKDINNFGILN